MDSKDNQQVQCDTCKHKRGNIVQWCAVRSFENFMAVMSGKENCHSMSALDIPAPDESKNVECPQVGHECQNCVSLRAENAQLRDELLDTLRELRRVTR